jgi:hypothetical protein
VIEKGQSTRGKLPSITLNILGKLILAGVDIDCEQLLEHIIRDIQT